MKSFLFASLVFGLAACGGVRHAQRPDRPLEPKDPSLVEVRTTGYDGKARVVSYSTWDVDPNDDLPVEAPEGVVEDMREEAASYGADMLLLDRIEGRWRKLWLGTGIKKDEAATSGVPMCTQKGYDQAASDAKTRAMRCAKGLLVDRPAVRGMVSVVFEVDSEGQVLRAAATPDSSRDSELQECVLQSVHTTWFGPPAGFSCQGKVEVSVDGPNDIK